jgi:hypothetical protein
MNKVDTVESLIGIYLGTICMICLGGFCQNVLGVDFNTLSGMSVMVMNVGLGVFIGMYLASLTRKVM